MADQRYHYKAGYGPTECGIDFDTDNYKHNRCAEVTLPGVRRHLPHDRCKPEAAKTLRNDLPHRSLDLRCEPGEHHLSPGAPTGPPYEDRPRAAPLFNTSFGDVSRST